MSGTPRLKTPRFVLRPLVRADAAALFPSFADPDCMRWWSRGPFSSVRELADYLVPPPGSWRGGRSWVVAESEHGPAIGRLVAIDCGDRVSEIGYMVVRGRQGEGIAGEAVGALVDHLIGREGRRRLDADIDAENEASNRLCRGLGFTLEGHLREAVTTHRGRRDSLVWGMLAADWRAARRG